MTTNTNESLAADPISPANLLVDRRPPCTFLVVCILIAILKIWMMHGDEIAARVSPMDDVCYMQSAKAWYWGRPYDHYALLRLPAYPLWIAAVKLIGIPLRLASEFALFLASYFFARSMFAARLPWVICVAIFAALALNPWDFVVSMNVVTDVLYAPLLIASLAAIVRVFCESPERFRRQISWSILAGAALALLWLTREESELIVIYLLAATAIALVVRPGKIRNLRRFGREIFATAIIPGAVIAIALLAVSSANFSRYGMFGISDPRAAEFVAANRALLRIRPSEPVRYVAVTQESLQRAYAISPAMAELKPALDHPWGSAAPTTNESNRAAGQIPTALFFPQLREAAAAAGHYKSVGDMRIFFKRIADEINATCDDGRLPTRPVFSSFVDPDFSMYGHDILPAFGRLSMMFAEKKAPFKITDELSDQQNPASPADVTMFDEMANRRIDLPHAGRLEIHGWAFASPENPITKVQVRVPPRVLASSNQFSPRGDVVSRLAGKSPPENCGFAIESPLAPILNRNGKLAFVQQDGRAVRVPFEVDSKGVVTLAAPMEDGLTFTIESASASPIKFVAAETAKQWLWFIHGWAVTILTVLAIVAIFMLAFRLRVAIRTEPIAVGIAILLFVVIGGRMAMFSIIDASCGSLILSARYLFPVMGLYTCLNLIVIWLAFRVERVRRSGEKL